MQLSTLLLLAASSLTVDAWPSQRGLTAPRLEPISIEQQQRIRELDPPVMHDGRYHADNNQQARPCPPALVPRIFPADKFAFTAATSYCSMMLAPSTTWTTVTQTPTAYFIRGTVLTVQPAEATADPVAAIDYHVKQLDQFQVTAACNCLVKSVGPNCVATRTKTMTAAVKTIVPAAQIKPHVS